MAERLTPVVVETQRRSAIGTGDGLGVETAIQRRFIFSLAGVAKSETFHRSIGPVIGKAFDEGITRTTLGTVDKRIAKTSIRGIGKLLETGITGEVIRWDIDSVLFALLALHNGEAGTLRGNTRLSEVDYGLGKGGRA
jgi:hypothetical protein